LGIALRDGAVAGGKWPDAIFADVEQRVFRVMREEPEAVRSHAIADAVPIVRAGVAEKVRNRRVEVPSPKNHEHVVDHVALLTDGLVFQRLFG
jgi:hypothetical protein